MLKLIITALPLIVLFIFCLLSLTIKDPNNKD